MAKRKLSSQKRVELRAQLKKSVASGKKVADVLREVAAKYGITTITARWYLNSLDGKPKKKKPGRKGAARGPGRPAGRPAGTKGNHAGFLKIVMAKAESATTAKKLVPRWQMLVDRELALKRQANKIQQRLAATSEKASKLYSRITQLVGH